MNKWHISEEHDHSTDQQTSEDSPSIGHSFFSPIFPKIKRKQIKSSPLQSKERVVTKDPVAQSRLPY